MPSALKLAAAMLASCGAVALASPLLNNDVAAVHARDEWQPTSRTLTCLYLTNEANWQGEGINLCEVGGSCGKAFLPYQHGIQQDPLISSSLHRHPTP